jgi:hypothetical protein
MRIGNKEYEFIDFSSASLRFFVYPDPKGSEEPEFGEAKINLLTHRRRQAFDGRW